MISQVVLAIERYSASTEEHDTTYCFLDLHEMREEPRNTQKPETERRVLGHIA